MTATDTDVLKGLGNAKNCRLGSNGRVLPPYVRLSTPLIRLHSTECDDGFDKYNQFWPGAILVSDACIIFAVVQLHKPCYVVEEYNWRLAI